MIAVFWTLSVSFGLIAGCPKMSQGQLSLAIGMQSVASLINLRSGLMGPSDACFRCNMRCGLWMPGLDTFCEVFCFS